MFSPFRQADRCAPLAAPALGAADAIELRISRRSALALGGMLLLGGMSGCRAVPINVGNPIPGMTVVAVAPFLNLSAEPSIDGRRFAIAYYSELQKTANYQVVPVGIVESAIRENELDITNPAQVVRLAQLLEADAVVIGAVTEYNPYYPPQLGVQISWYSPHEWIFFPGVSSGDEKGNQAKLEMMPACPPGEVKKPQAPLVRGQSLDEHGWPHSALNPEPEIRLAQGTRNMPVQPPPVWPPVYDPAETFSGSPARQPPAWQNKAFVGPGEPESPQPIMSYTRFFDGADRRLILMLRGYYILRGDMRSGGWEAYLHRSDDFLRFTSHILIVEMLSLHGGSLKTEKVLLY